MTSPSATAPSEQFCLPYMPTETDVVSTKIRTFNTGLKGNIAYTDLISKYSAQLAASGSVPVEAKEIRRTAESIVGQISSLGGRFLKIPDGEMNPTKCYEMERAAAINKAVNALKQALMRLSDPTGSTSKSPKGGAKAKGSKNSKFSKSPTAAPPAAGSKIGAKYPSPSPRTKPSNRPQGQNSTVKKNRTRQVEFVEEYQVKRSESMSIDDYAVELIQFVCNHKAPDEAMRELDFPIGKFKSIPEPEKEEYIRSQFRQRLLSARAVDVDAIEFCKRLLTFSKASLVKEKREKVEEGVVETVFDIPSSKGDKLRPVVTDGHIQDALEFLDQNSIDLEGHTEPFVDPFSPGAHDTHLLPSPPAQNTVVNIDPGGFLPDIRSQAPAQLRLMNQQAILPPQDISQTGADRPNLGIE